MKSESNFQTLWNEFFLMMILSLLPGNVKVSILVPLTNFKVPSPWFLTPSSFWDYTFHVAVDWWWIHAGALSQEESITHGQAMINLPHLFCSGTELAVPKCVMGLRSKLLQRLLRWVPIWGNIFTKTVYSLTVKIVLCKKILGGFALFSEDWFS